MLADRVGIIDHGRIVAEGTPSRLEGGDRAARASRPSRTTNPIGMRSSGCCHGSAIPAAALPGYVAVRLDRGDGELADVVRALDADGLHVAQLQLHEPSLDDVFLAKTGRLLEGAERSRGGARPGMSTLVATQVRALARRSVRRTIRQPANIVFALVFPLMLLAVNAGGSPVGHGAARASRPTAISTSSSPSPSSRERSSRRSTPARILRRTSRPAS